MRLDSGELVPVLELSDGAVRFGLWPGDVPKAGSDFSGVLVTTTGEMPISGKVVSTDGATVLVSLDLLIDEYRTTLRDYLTRVQMLDFVV